MIEPAALWCQIAVSRNTMALIQQQGIWMEYLGATA
jgi:hypothetical protein